MRRGRKPKFNNAAAFAQAIDRYLHHYDTHDPAPGERQLFPSLKYFALFAGFRSRFSVYDQRDRGADFMEQYNRLQHEVATRQAIFRSASIAMKAARDKGFSL